MNKTISLKGICPVCDAGVNMPFDTQESEVVSCPDCKSHLVIDEIVAGKLTLSKAPEVEEDWGQ